ncbi:BPTD_3080 family restriction endonuclease [Wenzhouxiangella sediminis]|uniref:Restriction endonuclease n=1 Tax=Wenzhouxiangella sediminis TaxID=1792836 RepID=A0A3E1K626_9GAMM|nr:DEAD/DEAH box helicase family protein [Wenzhouxiangella sediminis]RFF29400.1 restriction endonuclease [Wenzhouxiangella sediminis]
MSEEFFKKPILNSPYDYPGRHWELDDSGQPTHNIKESRRRADFVTPIPRAKRQSGGQQDLDIESISDDQDLYANATIINALRDEVDRWRQLPNPSDWKVTPETQRLLQHWRHHKFSGIRPFFCQVEAAETAIWLSEVAPKMGKSGARFLDHLKDANNAANPDLSRLALKLATGAGKTTVMAMLIAWQCINSVRHPTSTRFTRGFLIVTPGITIRDRLQVLQPNDPYSYYRSRELVPNDMLDELNKARIVITNYHAFKLRERMDLSKGGRQLLQGRGGDPLQTQESEGQMLQRVMPELMGMKNIMAMNDEAHHCYREKPGDGDEDRLKGDERKEAEKNLEAARLWINGLEAVNRKLGISRVMDLSATPFFLKGSGYVEGTLFPWTMSDFSLMDAIECGIVKLPRVPVADNIPTDDMPKFRNLWEHIGTKMPKKGRGKAKTLDPQSLPDLLKSALDALYGHYASTYQLWQREGVNVPPCFIIVCNNTATSKLVYDYIAGYEKENEDGTITIQEGHLELFRNYDEYGEPLARPRTLLIDSEQLESGDALDLKFRKMAADEIERFKEEIRERTKDQRAADNLTDADLLREVMNTVGKEGRLGESIRCVVSVSMLTEGWDANTVTHVLGVRAFGTQLLCEQVIGRALRRQSYDLNEDDRFNVEYADVLGIPFDFTAKPVVAPPQPPRETIQVRAVRPERDHLEIRFPRVEGYRTELPGERLVAEFTEDSKMVITPADVGPTKTRNEGIIGEGIDLDLKHLKDMRKSTLVYHLTERLLMTKWRDPGDEPELHLFGQLKRITRQWLDQCLECKGGTYPAQLMYQDLAERACVRITNAITRHELKKDGSLVRVVLDPYNPEETTSHVNFNTSSTERWATSPERCHVNFAILDSGWEGEFCRVLESHPRVLRYVKNHNLGLEVPYRCGSESRTYIPDFIVDIDDGRGEDDPLHLIVEIKGFRGEDVKDKHTTMENYWIPGVNNLGRFGRWDFVELSDVWEMESDLADKLEQEVDEIIQAKSREIPA